jgi:hypothetical protein
MLGRAGSSRYMPGLVPGAGSALTLGAALRVAGDDGGGAFVCVAPKVIRGGATCAVGTLIAASGRSTSRPTAPIAMSAPMPIAASADLYAAMFSRC